MKNKSWEIEFFAFDLQKGEVELICISEYYIEARTFQEAFFKLRKERNPYWRLSGRWFKNPNEAQDIQNIVDSMDFDEFYEWLDSGTEKDIRSALQRFKLEGLTNKVKMMEAYLKNKFNNDKEKNNQDEGK